MIWENPLTILRTPSMCNSNLGLRQQVPVRNTVSILSTTEAPAASWKHVKSGECERSRAIEYDAQLRPCRLSAPTDFASLSNQAFALLKADIPLMMET